MQTAVSQRWGSLDQPILQHLPRATSIEWLSPLQHDDFAEYRDVDFLTRLGVGHLDQQLRSFWPTRGPQWDALGRTNDGALLLVEAKAHVGEFCSPGTAAGQQSRLRIDEQLNSVADRLGAAATRVSWSDLFYQLANRIAHLSFLRDAGEPAYLVLVNFLNDHEMRGPTSVDAWEAAYRVARYAMGLPERHALSRYILHVYPDVAAATG